MPTTDSLIINERFSIPMRCIKWHAIRSQGAGGQNVNKVSSAVCVQLDIHATPMPQTVRNKLLARKDFRITAQGLIVIKAQEHRSQLLNKEEAFNRLTELLNQASHTPKKRIKTKPTRGSVERRIKQKSQRGSVKKLRSKSSFSE